MAIDNLSKLPLIVKGHHLDPIGKGIFELGRLLAGVGIDDPAGFHPKRCHQLNLILEKRNRAQAQTGSLDKQITSDKQKQKTHDIMNILYSGQACNVLSFCLVFVCIFI